MNLLNVNSTHLKLLAPLQKWRVLDLASLKSELNYKHSRQNFERVIKRLDKSDIIKSYTDPWSRKKFIYLTSFGADLIDGDCYDPSKDRGIYFHDGKIGELTRELIKKSSLTSFNFPTGSHFKRSPIDVIFEGEINSTRFKLGFILKFVTKNIDNVATKTRDHFLTNSFDYLLYYFCNKSSAQGYQKLLKQQLSSELFKRVMIFYNPTILSASFDLNLSRGYFKDREVMLSEVLT
jgi:hypothetical protein